MVPGFPGSVLTTTDPWIHPFRLLADGKGYLWNISVSLAAAFSRDFSGGGGAWNGEWLHGDVSMQGLFRNHKLRNTCLIDFWRWNWLLSTRRICFGWVARVFLFIILEYCKDEGCYTLLTQKKKKMTFSMLQFSDDNFELVAVTKNL